MTEDSKKKLFVDFGKLQEHNSINPTGTGLGLSICKLIVDKMNGKIEVDSKKGMGTTFRILMGTKARIPFQEKPKYHILDQKIQILQSSGSSISQNSSSLNASE